MNRLLSDASRSLLLAASLALAGCASAPTPQVAETPACPPRTPCPACPACLPCPVCPPAVVPPPAAKPMQESRYADIPGWAADDPRPALQAFRRSCAVLARQPAWKDVCAEAERLADSDESKVRAYFEARFVPYQMVGPDGARDGLITGYYEPLLKGSRGRSERFRHALYAVPDDLLTIELADLHPELKGLRLRGRIEGRKVVPYYSRGELGRREAELASKTLLWVTDPVELFFLQVQGSGRVELEDGQRVRVGYADQNGHPYRSIGRVLVERGDLKLEEASMEGIKNWGKANPGRLAELLEANPSYVFFRELPGSDGGPIGALGVPLTDGRSLAVDPKWIPLGAPVFIATTWPNTTTPLNRLMLAQDTGGAIRGVVRADFFWGFGTEAGRLAGRMRQRGNLWTLLPAGLAPN